VIDVVADEVRRGAGNDAVHKDTLGAAVDGDGSNGINGIRIGLAVPAELREPDVVLGVDLCVTALCEWDFAVIAEAVGINR